MTWKNVRADAGARGSISSGAVMNAQSPNAEIAGKNTADRWEWSAFPLVRIAATD